MAHCDTFFPWGYTLQFEFILTLKITKRNVINKQTWSQF